MSLLNRIFDGIAVSSMALGALLWAGPAMAQEQMPTETRADSAVATQIVQERPHHRLLVFNQSNYATCDYFLVSDVDVKRVMTNQTDPSQQYIVTNSLGFMKNTDERNAIGASIDLLYSYDELRVSPTVHYKRWLNQQQSVDVSLSYFGERSTGLVGPMLNARYNMANYVFAEGGLCQTDDYDISGSDSYNYTTRKQVRPYIGVGLGGLPGKITMAGEAVTIGVMLIVFIGSEANSN